MDCGAWPSVLKVYAAPMPILGQPARFPSELIWSHHRSISSRAPVTSATSFFSFIVFNKSRFLSSFPSSWGVRVKYFPCTH